MIFAVEGHCEKILAGTKTQTRRRYVEGEPSKYVVGKTYAVQPGRGKKSVGRIEITKIRHEKVSDISEADLLAEGGYTRDEYLALWHKMYNVDPQTALCWVLDFKVVNRKCNCGVDLAIYREWLMARSERDIQQFDFMCRGYVDEGDYGVEHDIYVERWLTFKGECRKVKHENAGTQKHVVEV